MKRTPKNKPKPHIFIRSLDEARQKLALANEEKQAVEKRIAKPESVIQGLTFLSDSDKTENKAGGAQ